MNYTKIWPVLKKTIAAWNQHDAPRLSAAIAFYTILSLAPLAIFVIAIVSVIYGHAAAQNELLEQIESMIGQQGAEVVKGMIEYGQKPASGAVASVIGAIALLFGASGVFGELRSAFDTVWDVNTQSEGGLWGTIKERFFSFGMVLAVGLLVVISVTASVVLAAVVKFFGTFLTIPAFVLNTVDVAVSLVGFTVVFAAILRFVPAVKAGWKSVWTGALVTALLFTIGKFPIALYLGKAAVGSAYGAAGSLIVVLVWVYYSAMIFLFGAELTHVLDSGAKQQHPISGLPALPE